MDMRGNFRGRRTDKRWVFGYYFAKPILDKHFILLGEEQWLVDKDTVGMCSCVPDKHGHMLYEGDIVTYPWCSTTKMMFVVAFVDGEFRLRPVKSVCNVCQFFGEPCEIPCEIWEIRMSEESAKMELIGNVFDNPKLVNA